MKKSKLLTIPIVLIMTLAFCGIAYAHWYDQVHIDGVTKGGTVNIAFDTFEPAIYWEFHEVDGVLVPGEYLGKDVGYGFAYLDLDSYEEDPHTDKFGYERMVIDIFCAYPSYRVHTQYVIRNIGTIPVNICKLFITGERWTKDQPGVPGVKEYDLIFVAPDPDFPFEGELWEDRFPYGEFDPDVDVLVINFDYKNGDFPYQLDPCHTQKGEVDIHFKQDASQCHRYKIFVEIVGLQWNKDCDEWDYPND
jgi:hypothetical protein